MDNNVKCCYYRVTDPLENLKIGINIHEGTRVKADGELSKPFSCQRIISWQEKIHGPTDIAAYLRFEDKNTPDAAKSVGDREIVRQLKLKEKEGVDIEELLQPTMLFTYIQKEDYLNVTPPPIAESNGMESYVGAALRRTSHLNEETMEVDDRSIKVENRSFREKPYKSMFICLAHNVDVAAFSSTHKLWDESFYYDTTILTEIRLYSDGLMEMTPGFSSICEEGYVGSSKQTPAPDKNLTLTNISQSMPGPAGEPNLEQMEEQDNLSNGLPVSKSLFVDNQTIFAGFKHGLRAQTYSVRTKDGVLYEYSLENINEMPLIDACNDFRSVSRPMDNGPATTTNAATSKSTISSGPSVGAGADLSKWKQDPPCKDYDYTSSLFAEIVSGTGFEGRKVFVSYEMLVPTGTGDTQWQLRKGNLVDGVVAKDIISSYYQEDTKPTMSSTTNLFGTNKDNYSGVQNPLIMRNMLDNKDSEGALHGSTHVAVNKQIYGRYALGCGSSESGQNSTEMFKYSDLYPEHFQILGKNMTETTRLILGSCFFVFSCLSVTLGLSSPCWIIPCVVIFMVLGMGMPGGGDILVMNNQRKKLNDNETVRRVISHTNTSEVYNIPASTCLTDPVAHFNHLINVSFDVKCNRSSFTENKVNKDDLERFKNIKAEMGCTSDSIIVVFEVYSLGWFGRCTTEGYGYVSIPLYGKIDTEIKTWKPLGSLSSRVYEYYMGGSSALHNNRFVGIPNPKQRSINRYGVVTEASGTLRFRANMTRSDPRSMVSADEEEKQRRQQTLKVRKTVDDILTNFKATGSVSSNAINKTLLRASASKDQISSMNSSKLGSLLHRAGSPSGGASVSASATGLPTNIKEIVKDNSRVNSRVADIIARARQSKAASSAKDLGSGTTTSSSNVQSQSAIAMVERNASNRTSKNTSKNADSDELEVEVSSSRVRVLPRSQNVPSTQSINNRAPLIPKSSSHTTNTTSGGRYSDVSKSTDSDA